MLRPLFGMDKGVVPLRLQQARPLGLFEAGQHALFRDQQRAFDEHPVRREQRYLFVVGHRREFFLQAEIFIGVAACVEEFFERQAGAPVPLAQLLRARVLRLDVPLFVRDSVVFEPLRGFLTGASRRVAEQKHIKSPPCC